MARKPRKRASIESKEEPMRSSEHAEGLRGAQEDGEEVFEDAIDSSEDDAAAVNGGPAQGSDTPPRPPLPEGAGPDRPVRVYADGIYDLFHFGHARSLEQAKLIFPHTHLLVGCCNDELTHKYKGKTVFTAEERYESLRHCKWVDEVVKDAPWVITPEFIEKHKIDYVAHDALPYSDASGSCDDVYGWVKKAGKFAETKRTEGVSTSDIIMRILKDYNEYVIRNLSRGFSRKEMGVSFMKEKQLRVNMGVNKLRQKVREQQERVGKKVRERVEKNKEFVREVRDNVGTVVRTAQHMALGQQPDRQSEWLENADRWVSGFLQKFEEGVHTMEKAIHDKLIKPRMKRLPSGRKAAIAAAGASA